MSLRSESFSRGRKQNRRMSNYGPDFYETIKEHRNGAIYAPVSKDPPITSHTKEAEDLGRDLEIALTKSAEIPASELESLLTALNRLVDLASGKTPSSPYKNSPIVLEVGSREILAGVIGYFRVCVPQRFEFHHFLINGERHTNAPSSWSILRLFVGADKKDPSGTYWIANTYQPVSLEIQNYGPRRLCKVELVGKYPGEEQADGK